MTASAEALGIALRRRRRDLRMTQAEVAELAGTRQATVSDLERGKATAQVRTLLVVAGVLGLEVELLDRDGNRIVDVASSGPDDGG